MDLNEIERLVDMIREAKVSELTVSVGDSTVRLRKPLRPAPAATAVQAPPKPEALQVEVELAEPEPFAAETWITAPMVGIFHGLDKTGAVGSTVKAGQVVGAIESMKLMNEVVSECEGVIAEVAIEDGMPVEYGQRLFRLEE